MEQLVGEHERLGEQARDMQDLAERYRSEAEKAVTEATRARSEAGDLRRDL